MAGPSIKEFAEKHGVAYGTVLRWLSDPDDTAEDAWRIRSAGGWRLNPAWADAFVPPSVRAKAKVTAAGLLTTDGAALYLGCSVATISSAARAGGLPCVLIDGLRAFSPADLTAWRKAKVVTRLGARPLVTVTQAARILGYASASTVLHHIRGGRLHLTVVEQGQKWLKRAEVEAFGAGRKAKKARKPY